MKVKQIITDADAGANGVRLKFNSADNPDSTPKVNGPFSFRQ